MSGPGHDAGPGPGAARNGNFKNYYQFNPPSERLKLLPNNLLGQLKKPPNGWQALDVGCNSGDLTCGLLEHFPELEGVLGVDLDQNLVDVAKKRHETFIQSKENRIKFKKLDLMQGRDDVTKNLDKSFAITFCFSVTMWIHLNHGDEGLKRFIETISKLTKYLVLEPQPWKCYRTASRRMRKLGQPDFEQLKVMKNINEESLMKFIDRICEEVGFTKLKVFGETDNWKRKLILFERC